MSDILLVAVIFLVSVNTYTWNAYTNWQEAADFCKDQGSTLLAIDRGYSTDYGFVWLNGRCSWKDTSGEGKMSSLKVSTAPGIFYSPIDISSFVNAGVKLNLNRAAKS